MSDPGISILALTQSLTLFQSFLPKFTEIRAANPEEHLDMVRDVRAGELAAVLLTLGVGGMTAALTGSSTPVYVAVVSSAGLVMLYEYALRSKTEVNLNA